MVPKKNEKRIKTAGERLYLDVSYINGVSMGGAKFWLLVVNEVTRYKWSFFMNKKSELASTVANLIKQI